MIAPNCDWFKFSSEKEKIQMFRQWGFIPKRQKWMKTMFYCGTYIDKPKICEIVGYIDELRIVLSINGQLHTINPDYLLQMQPSPPSSYPEKYIVLDLETTGFSASKSKILEIAAIKYFRDKEYENYHTMVNPNCDLNTIAESINHIDHSMISDAPCIEDVLPNFINFIGNLPLIAHNATFDIGFLKRESQKVNLKITNTTFDTLKLAREAFPGLESYSLSRLVKELNIPIKNTHRALDDTQAAAILFQKCLQKLYPAIKFSQASQPE